MDKMASLFIIIIFIYAFSINTLLYYGYVPITFRLIPEVLIYLLFMYSLIGRNRSKQTKYDFHLLYAVCFFLLCAGFSIVVNSYYNIKPAIGIRTMLRF